jgi:hypothetical protein
MSARQFHFNPKTLPKECQVMLDACDLVERTPANKKQDLIKRLDEDSSEIKQFLDRKIEKEEFDDVDDVLENYSRILDTKTFIENHIVDEQ